MPDADPGLVDNYLERALPAGGDVPRGVRIHQAGQMWLKPGARPKRFTAVQEYVVARLAFRWRARFTVGLASLRVEDRLSRGEGSLEARLFGLIPVNRQRGPQVAEGQALRYLAELPWVPHALVANGEIELSEVDPHTVEAATVLGDARPSVRLQFDDEGDIAGATALRPRAEDKNRPTPWSGSFSDYHVLGGIRLPTKGEVRWELDEGPFTYWSGEIKGLEQIL